MFELSRDYRRGTHRKVTSALGYFPRMKGPSFCVALITSKSCPWPAQYALASLTASALRLPVPLNPVAAWRATMKEPAPMGTTPELAAHPQSAVDNAKAKVLIARIAIVTLQSLFSRASPPLVLRDFYRKRGFLPPKSLKSGALGGIRIPDPCLRRAVLYPAELRVRARRP